MLVDVTFCPKCQEEHHLRIEAAIDRLRCTRKCGKCGYVYTTEEEPKPVLSTVHEKIAAITRKGRGDSLVKCSYCHSDVIISEMEVDTDFVGQLGFSARPVAISVTVTGKCFCSQHTAMYNSYQGLVRASIESNGEHYVS